MTRRSIRPSIIATTLAVVAVGAVSVGLLPTAGAATSYTMDQVRQHATSADCWTAVSGNVYNLTSWIRQHPGGSSSIISMCGTDGTAAFNRMHGGQARPEQVLAGYLLGPLAADTQATPSSSSTGTPSTGAPATTSPGNTYTMAQVRRHARAANCWSVVSGVVYELTKWIRRHPGGSSAIRSMCGRDATAAFANAHGGQARARQQLTGYAIGTLAGSGATLPTPAPSSSINRPGRGDDEDGEGHENEDGEGRHGEQN